MTPVTKGTVKALGSVIAAMESPIKIVTKGVSRAQIGKISGDLVRGTDHTVSVRRLPSTGIRIGSVENYEILVKKSGRKQGRNAIRKN